MTDEHAAQLAPQIATIDPWHRLEISETAIFELLAKPAPDQLRRTILSNGVPVGAIVVRRDWLLGPYLRHLSLIANARGIGLGDTAIEWLVTYTTAEKQRNIWLCVSEFNTPAQRFYIRHGFEAVQTLDDLVKPGENEILMRRRLPRAT